MHYALNPRTFLFSHYFYTGLRTAIGVIGLTSLVYHFGDLASAMTVCIGAMCTSFMDLPGPLRHKFHEMLASVLLCSFVTLVITLCASSHWLLGVTVVLVSFVASMMLVYGKKTMPLQFAALFIMTLSLENEMPVQQALVHSALFFCGAASYMLYAMAAAWLLRNRIKQQVLAEALFELARYVDIKSEFYDMRTPLRDQFNLLVRQQSVLADKQQASRDLILRGKPTAHDAILIQVHFGMLDLYEMALSTHTDYAQLRRHLGDHDVLTALHDMASKAARDTETIAFAVTRDRPSYPEVDYSAEQQRIEATIALYEQHPRAHGHEALTVLRSAYNKLRSFVDTLAQLHAATQHPDAPPVLPGADMTPFVTKQKYETRVLLDNLNWQSPTFRFAIRIALAITVGMLISEHLPYASHGYWIILTIAIVLKPTYSMTKQRRTDRLIGTTIGCLLTAIILHFVHAPAAILGFLFLATVATSAFVYVRYRYTAIAASMQILLQISLLVHNPEHEIGERIIDTFLGVAIAFFFSYVLPSWEYKAIPQLIANVLSANRRYLEAGCDLLTAKVNDDFVYRICRKGLFDNLASLSSALVRMLDEPESKQRGAEDIHMFIVQNYLIAANVAALRILLRRHVKDMPKELVDDMLRHACADVCNGMVGLEHALKALLPQLVEDKNEQAIVVHSSVGATVTSAWTGWDLLRRRLAMLRDDAHRINTHGLSAGRALSHAD
jgi:uncharacterized membrane protein YccC